MDSTDKWAYIIGIPIAIWNLAQIVFVWLLMMGIFMTAMQKHEAADGEVHQYPCRDSTDPLCPNYNPTHKVRETIKPFKPRTVPIEPPNFLDKPQQPKRKVFTASVDKGAM